MGGVRGVCVPVPSAVSSPDMVRGLQERAARALPAQQAENAEGWWLRSAACCAWWVGTVLPHADAGPGELERRVVRAEEFYAGHHVAARFQVSPLACPAGLDTVLAERGYRRQAPASLQVASTARVLGRLPAGSLGVRVDDRPTGAWSGAWHTAAGQGGAPRAEWGMLGRVQRPSAYACVMSGDEVVAVGRAVADAGWAGVFGMATLPGARGKGAARQVLAALAGWAGTHQAGRMYLQVERGNTPARRLYERAGFRELCGYHYRVAR